MLAFTSRTIKDEPVAVVKFDKEDVYALDTTLAHVIVAGLREYRKLYAKTSYPLHLGDVEQWQAILDEMIWGFDQVATGARYELPKTEEKRLQESFELFGKYFQYLWD